MPEYDKSGWTVFEPALCVCIEVRIGNISINGSVKPVFILELLDLKTDLIGIKWLPVNKSKKHGYSVKHDSNFAKLYRLSTGYVSKARYSKAEQLLQHFIGCKFIAEFENKQGTNGKDYLRVKTIEPVNPFITEGWFSDGRLRDKNWKPTGNGLEINGKKSGNGLETGKAENPHLNLVSPTNSTPLKDIASKIEPYTHTELIPVVKDKYETTIEVVNGAKTYRGHQQPNETEEQYHERIIAESLGNQ